MKRLLELPSGSQVDPQQIGGIIKFPSKGVAVRNEYNKIISFEKDSDAIRQTVITRVLGGVVNAGEDWIQPDWDAEFAKALPTPKAGGLSPQKPA